MEFKEFVEYVKNEVCDYLLQYNIDKVYVEEVRKNNGIKLTGLIIATKDETVYPNIYLEGYYKLLEGGKELSEIMQIISDDYKAAKDNLSINSISVDIEHLKQNIFIKVINYEKNKEQLNNCPYIRFHDLAISFRYLVDLSETGISSALLRNSDKERLNISTEELYKNALENTKRLFPPVIERLGTMLADKFEDDSLNCQENNLYILTNNQGINGASYIVYEDIISDFAKTHDTDLFILPSSIHEILLLPVEDSMDKEELVEMVKEINSYAVPDLDYLSDNVYFYDRKIGKIIE